MSAAGLDVDVPENVTEPTLKACGTRELHYLGFIALVWRQS
jgi:hypothetical protein